MPNSKHVPVCPYYEYEKKGFIKCEDCKKMFRYDSQKEKWMYMYCDSNWESCMYAKDLTKVYEENKDMDEQKYKALKSEFRKLELRLRRAEKRNEEKDAEIKDLKRIKNLAINRCRERDNQIKQVSEMNSALEGEIAWAHDFYQARLAYYMCTYENGVLKESDVEKWHEGKEFIIRGEQNEDEVTWVVETREEGEECEASTDQEKLQ